MNQAHIHLLVNHVSLFGVSFGLLALVWAIIKNSKDVRWYAVGLFLVSAVFAWIASETGEGAEEIVEQIPGILESMVERHEEAAELANISVMTLGVLAVLMEIIAKVKNQCLKKIQIGVLIVAIVSAVLLARTANLGGEIRHTEIRADGESTLILPAGNNETDHD